MRRWTSTLTALLVVAGCGSQDAAEPASVAVPDCSVCDHLASCTNQAFAKCTGTCNLFMLSATCSDAIRAASCEDSAKPPPALVAACATPTCDGDSATCNADGTIDLCVVGVNTRRYCAGACQDSGLSYTGTCGTSYHGRSSTTGLAVCWCE